MKFTILFDIIVKVKIKCEVKGKVAPFTCCFCPSTHQSARGRGGALCLSVKSRAPLSDGERAERERGVLT